MDKASLAAAEAAQVTSALEKDGVYDSGMRMAGELRIIISFFFDQYI